MPSRSRRVYNPVPTTGEAGKGEARTGEAAGTALATKVGVRVRVGPGLWKVAVDAGRVPVAVTDRRLAAEGEAAWETAVADLSRGSGMVVPLPETPRMATGVSVGVSITGVTEAVRAGVVVTGEFVGEMGTVGGGGSIGSVAVGPRSAGLLPVPGLGARTRSPSPPGQRPRKRRITAVPTTSRISPRATYRYLGALGFMARDVAA